MSKRIRVILFLILLSLFLTVAPSAILWSLGYRFNLETKKIVQTGGLFLKVVPSDVEVYIDGKLKDKTSFLFGTILIENLLPKTYEVKVKKEGYYSWLKSLETKEKQVTETKNIVLIPETPEFTFLEKNIENFWFSPLNKKVVYQKIGETGIWRLELFDIQLNTRHFLISERNLAKASPNTQQGVELLDLKWSSDGKKILLETSRLAKTKHFIIELDKEPPFLISLDSLGENIKEIHFNPKNSREIFFIVSLKHPEEEFNEDNLLFRVNYSKKEIPKLVLTSKPQGREISLQGKTEFSPSANHSLITYTIWAENIVWLSKTGFLYKSDMESGEILEVLNLKPQSIKIDHDLPAAEYKIITSGPSKSFLKENNTLYYLEPESREFKKISDSAKSLSFSPDFKKIVYFTDFEIWVFYLERLYDQPQREAQEKILLGRWTEKIDKCFWFTSHYLICNTGSKIKVAEIDDRDRINIVNLAEFNEPKIFWDEINKKLYILTNQNLIVVRGLLP